VATKIADVLVRASLSDAERRVVERLVELLPEELDSDLHAIWLYGSRARGETPHPESDIDLMVLADGVSFDEKMRATELVYRLAPVEGVSPVWFSFFFNTPKWLRGRREIRSFFIAEVDRDKLVLYGAGSNGSMPCQPPALRERAGMSPRSMELMDQASHRSILARQAIAAGHLEGAVSAAYYAMLYAARAALSESDEYARTHGGTWHLFHERYVTSGAFDQHLHTLAQKAQEAREQGDYEAITPDPAEAERLVTGAADYIAAIEAMLDK
jgi:uncharacterized protein (UPF0332 family)/predicted nucleotidyltransferase